MKLPQAQIRTAESMGRGNIGAVGGLARAKGARTSRFAPVMQHMAGVAKEFIQRKEDAEYNNALTSSAIELTAWEQEYATKEFYTAEEVADIPDDAVKKTIATTDNNGNPVNLPNNEIPAYEAYPYLLNKKMQGLIQQKAETITNPLLRQEFLNRSNQIAAKKNLDTALRAHDQQRTYLRESSDARRQQASSNGQIVIANKEAMDFEGSQEEKDARLLENSKNHEIWQADTLIQVEDMESIAGKLAELREDDYQGALNTKENLALQGRLSAKLNNLKARTQGQDRVYKARTKRAANDLMYALDDGHPRKLQEVQTMIGQLNNLKLEDMAIKVEDSYKRSPFVSTMYNAPTTEHEPMINAYVAKVATSENEAIRLRGELLDKSAQIDKRIQTDATGLWMERNMSRAPVPGEEDYFAKSLAISREAGEVYGVRAQPLSDEVATQLSQQFEHASVNAKTQFIAQAMEQVPDKVERDRFFKQIDKKGAGNLNVYADILERGEGAVIEQIQKGSELRQDKGLKLIPRDFDARANVALMQAFPVEAERRQYINAVKDTYAAATFSAGELTPEHTDDDLLETAVRQVAGNVVEHNGRRLQLPDNQMDSRDFNRWVTNLSPKYIDQLGGVNGMGSDQVAQGLRDGDIVLYPSQTRGEYYLQNQFGQYLNNREADPFLLKFERNAPKRSRASARSRGRS